MDLKFVVPNMQETFGDLDYAGEKGKRTKRVNGNTIVVSRTYSLYSSKQRADDVEVIVLGRAGEKEFAYEDRIKLINPKIVAEGYNIKGRAFTNYVLHADDIVKAE